MNVVCYFYTASYPQLISWKCGKKRRRRREGEKKMHGTKNNMWMITFLLLDFFYVFILQLPVRFAWWRTEFSNGFFLSHSLCFPYFGYIFEIEYFFFYLIDFNYVYTNWHVISVNVRERKQQKKSTFLFLTDCTLCLFRIKSLRSLMEINLIVGCTGSLKCL